LVAGVASRQSPDIHLRRVSSSKVGRRAWGAGLRRPFSLVLSGLHRRPGQEVCTGWAYRQPTHIAQRGRHSSRPEHFLVRCGKSQVTGAASLIRLSGEKNATPFQGRRKETSRSRLVRLGACNHVRYDVCPLSAQVAAQEVTIVKSLAKT